MFIKFDYCLSTGLSGIKTNIDHIGVNDLFNYHYVLGYITHELSVIEQCHYIHFKNTTMADYLKEA